MLAKVCLLADELSLMTTDGFFDSHARGFELRHRELLGTFDAAALFEDGFELESELGQSVIS